MFNTCIRCDTEVCKRRERILKGSEFDHLCRIGDLAGSRDEKFSCGW
jgi:hypothetical protein